MRVPCCFENLSLSWCPWDRPPAHGGFESRASVASKLLVPAAKEWAIWHCTPDLLDVPGKKGWGKGKQKLPDIVCRKHENEHLAAPEVGSVGTSSHFGQMGTLC